MGPGDPGGQNGLPGFPESDGNPSDFFRGFSSAVNDLGPTAPAGALQIDPSVTEVPFSRFFRIHQL
jgi:hypothetical protein